MRKFWRILIALIALRTFMLVLLITLDLPPTPGHDGWYFHHGGDEDSYFALAKSLVQFNPIRSVKTLGFPLMLTPFIYLFGANGPSDILVPTVILHAFIMFNLSIILVALIAEKLTKNKLISLSPIFIRKIKLSTPLILISRALYRILNQALALLSRTPSKTLTRAGAATFQE